MTSSTIPEKLTRFEDRFLTALLAVILFGVGVATIGADKFVDIPIKTQLGIFFSSFLLMMVAFAVSEFLEPVNWGETIFDRTSDLGKRPFKSLKARIASYFYTCSITFLAAGLMFMVIFFITLLA